MDQALDKKIEGVETCSSSVTHQARILNLDQNYQKVQDKYFSEHSGFQEIA